MIYLYILILLVLLLVLFFRKAIRGFKNPERPHDITPADHGIPFEELRIPTRNNKNLYGWFIRENRQAPTIILVHGWGRNAGRTMPYIRALHKQGFNLLAFDARHHGSSDRDDFSTMKKFAEDIVAVLDFLDQSELTDNRTYGILGLSIGGSAAIYASSHDSRISRVVTVGALADPLEIMKKQMTEHHVPYIPLGYLVLEYLQRSIKLRFSDIAPEKFISRSGAAFLLIHGEQDQTIPVSHAKRLHEASQKENTQLWLIKGKGHSDCHHEPDFWPRIIQFMSLFK
ncbi:MAG: alpha/beta fold hydrolase [bacterium]